MLLISAGILLFADTLPHEIMPIHLHRRLVQSADFAQHVFVHVTLVYYMVLFNVYRTRNTDRIIVAFSTQCVMLQKLTELSLSIHTQFNIWIWAFLSVFRRCCSAAPL